jgi:adenylate kinase
MRLIIFGPPGSGKGTYASRIKPKFGIAHISTGDIFRDAIKHKTSLGKIADRYISKGKLVPDKITNEIFKKRIKRKDCRKGFILDGYPRSISQVKFLEKISKIDAIINLSVPDWLIVKRLTARESCKKCGTIYNKLTLKPKKKGICDKCGGELFQRNDDTPKVVKKRLNLFKRQIYPLIKYYRKNKVNIIEIKCNKLSTPPEVIVKKILKGLKPLL